ncbi:hypothetical protein H2200_006262 [Cladophialophora chaetospira]|uniref:Mid2 domain-containing protein n=1 Tax=Cladophialophora chaetospira TaxID=386627 RepID=A0AA38XB98_9EURO|nr:hypothetical protein H2200_006262 [Cladophialophora chaetospira]
MLRNHFALQLPVLLLWQIPATWAKRFLNPPPWGEWRDFSQNAVFPEGEQQTFQWELDEKQTPGLWLELWQEVGIGPGNPMVLSYSVEDSGSFVWSGQFDQSFSDGDPGNVFYLALVDVDSKQYYLLSHYFNISLDPSATETEAVLTLKSTILILPSTSQTAAVTAGSNPSTIVGDPVSASSSSPSPTTSSPRSTFISTSQTSISTTRTSSTTGATTTRDPFLSASTPKTSPINIKGLAAGLSIGLIALILLCVALIWLRRQKRRMKQGAHIVNGMDPGSSRFDIDNGVLVREHMSPAELESTSEQHSYNRASTQSIQELPTPANEPRTSRASSQDCVGLNRHNTQMKENMANRRTSSLNFSRPLRTPLSNDGSSLPGLLE